MFGSLASGARGQDRASNLNVAGFRVLGVRAYGFRLRLPLDPKPFLIEPKPLAKV